MAIREKVRRRLFPRMAAKGEVFEGVYMLVYQLNTPSDDPELRERAVLVLHFSGGGQRIFDPIESLVFNEGRVPGKRFRVTHMLSYASASNVMMMFEPDARVAVDTTGKRAEINP